MEVPLTQGKVAHIDPDDWPLVAPHRWYAARTGGGKWYAHTAPPGGRGKAKLKMHNLILGEPWGDHRDGDGLNNRRANLRICTNAENQQNTAPRGGSSQFKGVAWNARRGRWRVQFNWRGQTYFAGYFAEEREAAVAYNAAILPLAGEFARLNDVGAER